MVLVAHLICTCMVVREMGYPRGHDGVHFDREGACVWCMLAFRHRQATCAGVSVFYFSFTFVPAPPCGTDIPHLLWPHVMQYPVMAESPTSGACTDV